MSAISLTDSAANKLRRLKASEGNDALMLRVYVTGGGCSGFSYGFDFAETLDDDDATFVNAGETLVVDSLSFPYLDGATIDYIEGVAGCALYCRQP